MCEPYGQEDYRVRLDWGATGAGAGRADLSVVVDVLSFSTSVCIAVERGMRVCPSPWKGAEAAAFAEQHDAVLAVGRGDAAKDGAMPGPTLSPAGLLAGPVVPRLVLPSPNGSTIAASLRDTGSVVAIGCLRNATATAEQLAAALDEGHSVTVIAAGERWAADDSLRPALEDHLGAGAILAALTRLGHDDELSPEAAAAADLFQAGRDRLLEWTRGCVSGRELTERGFGTDVDVAAQLDASRVVPVLTDGWFGRPS
nr:2-phosphosulfolactate phosphatase [Propionicimonas sp.]